MNYVSDTGVTFAESYWRPGQLLLGVRTKEAQITFLGYASQATRLDNKAPVGTHVYSISGTKYDTYFSAAVLQTKDPLASAYQLADDTLDNGGVSFFQGATDV